jgi:hypothetical protein
MDAAADFVGVAADGIAECGADGGEGVVAVECGEEWREGVAEEPYVGVEEPEGARCLGLLESGGETGVEAACAAGVGWEADEADGGGAREGWRVEWGRGGVVDDEDVELGAVEGGEIGEECVEVFGAVVGGDDGGDAGDGFCGLLCWWGRSVARGWDR